LSPSDHFRGRLVKPRHPVPKGARWLFVWQRLGNQVSIRDALPPAAEPCVRPERPTALPLGCRRASRDGARSTQTLGVMNTHARRPVTAWAGIYASSALIYLHTSSGYARSAHDSSGPEYFLRPDVEDFVLGQALQDCLAHAASWNRASSAISSILRGSRQSTRNGSRS
jgi:hypothetical protein